MRGAPQVRPAAAGGGSTPLVSPRRDDGRVRRSRPPASPSPEAQIDSRILARRRAVEHEEGLRRRRRALWLGGAVALVAVVLGITRTPLLDLDRVQVEVPGDTELDGAAAAAVTEALADAGVRAGAPLVDLDLTGGEQAVEALPWVAGVELRRRWPGTVTVEVEPRVAVATVAASGGAALIDPDGQVVAVVPPADAPEGLVAVEGPPDLAAGDQLDAAGPLVVAAAVPEALAPMVAMIGMGDGRSVVLQLRDGAVVDLGPPLGADDVADKLHAALTMLTQVDRTCMEVLDVSVPSVPTVTRRPGC